MFIEQNENTVENSISILVNLFKSLIRPILEYNSHILYHDVKKQWTRLDSKQAFGVNIVLVLMTSSSNYLALVEAGFPPLKFRSEFQSKKKYH